MKAAVLVETGKPSAADTSEERRDLTGVIVP